MERGDDGFDRLPKLAKSTSGLGINGDSSSSINITTTNNNGSNTGNSNTMPPPPTMVREQDQYMPIANVIRIMRRILPPHAKISDEAKETIQECVSEYISFITGEANERCQREQRKTVTAEDVIWAMGKLGFDNYVEPLNIFLSRYRESENDRTSVRGDGALKRGIDHGPIMIPPNAIASFRMGFQEGFLDAAATVASVVATEYYRDATGSSSAAGSTSPASLNNHFDPFGQFK